MTMQKVEAMVALSCLLAACSSEHSGSIIDRDAGMAVDAATLIDSGAEPPEPQRAFTHKMMKRTGENMFAMLGYECDTCSFEQHAAIVAPQGWTKGLRRSARLPPASLEAVRRLRASLMRWTLLKRYLVMSTS